MKETEMLNYAAQDKPPQKTFIHYVLKMTLDELNTFSDTLGVVQLSDYEVEKDTIACLALEKWGRKFMQRFRGPYLGKGRELRL